MNYFDSEQTTAKKSSYRKRPAVSVIIPMYKAECYLRECVDSVLAQTYKDFEIIAVDDGSPDNCAAVIESYEDPRLRLVQQENRGLAGARNTGIRQSRGRYIAFLDSDDFWHPRKLECHVGHLDHRKHIGVSYSGSAFIDKDSQAIGLFQRPKLHDVKAQDIFCRNPVGNGSAPVIRREVLESIGFLAPETSGHFGHQYFDETFRQSEDIECWLRIALSTDWAFEGLSDILTYYRINEEGLSANWRQQLDAWERAVDNNSRINAEFVFRWQNLARAYQYRYLARRAVQSRDAKAAAELIRKALTADSTIILREFGRTTATIGATLLLNSVDADRYSSLERQVVDLVGA